MTWIRSPGWDGVWILSAPLLGLLLVFFPALMSLALLLRFAHALSPIALAWSHRGYRLVMMRQPGKFIGMPALLFVLALCVAWGSVRLFPEFSPHRMVLEYLTLDRLKVPIVVWANLYAVWDLYHGGAQDFGIWCLYRRKSVWGRRKWAILLAFIASYVAVSHGILRWFPSSAVYLFLFGLVTINHSLAAIGLCAHVNGRHYGISPLYFAGGMLLFGVVGSAAFLWGMKGSLSVATFAVALYAWLGIWHFLQDRWIWQLSKPEVRATIGADLFLQAA